MALTTLTDNLNIHQSLPNQPALTPEKLKEEFDKAGNLIKIYLNEVLIPELDTTITKLQGKDTNVESTVSNLRTTLQEAVTNITKLQSTANTSTGSINTLKTDVTNLQSSVSTINNNISTIQGKLPKISKGTAIPSSLANGEIYFQYF